MKNSAIEVMASRRSVKAKLLQEPAPSSEILAEILNIASRVPDHKKKVPWRFILCDKAGQEGLGEVIGSCFLALHPDAEPRQVEAEKRQMQRAPLLIVLVYQPELGNVPEWEQQLTVGAVGMNLLQAVHATGFAGQWLSEWPCYDAGVHKALGLGEHDRLAGFFYIGSCDTPPEMREDRARPVLESVALSWEAWQAGKR